MAKVYVATGNGVIDSDALAATARLLVSVSNEEPTFTSDADGHYFDVSEDHLDAFMAVVDTDTPKKRRGRGKAKPAEPAAEPDVAETPSDDVEVEDPDTQE